MAAEAVFAERGFQGATVQEIADRAEFAVGSLYNLFPSKDALYRELVELRLKQYIERVRRSIGESGAAMQKARAVIAAKLWFFSQNERFLRIFSHMLAGEEAGSTSPSPRFIQMYRKYLDSLTGVFAQGIEEGVFRAGDPRLMALVVDGATSAVIQHCLFSHQFRLEESVPEELERLLFEGLLAERDDK